MRAVFWPAAIFGLMIAGLASAQTSPDQKPQAQTPSASKPDSSELGGQEPAGLAAGANSFAEGQARALLKARGYDNVSALVNDPKGIWRGTATKGNAKVQVSVDYMGHVDAK